MVIGYMFSRQDNKEFPIIADATTSMFNRKQQCEEVFYSFIKDNLLAKILSIEDK